MKKFYSKPRFVSINVESEEIIAVSNWDKDSNTGSQNVGNAQQGSGSEDLGADGYRSNLWD